MPKKKKEHLLRRFLPYMGRKKALLPLSLFLSGLSAILNLIPFILVWFIVREVLSGDLSADFSSIGTYAWLSFASALGGVVIYFFALMSSHLAAFRVEVGMQQKGMRKLIAMPLGFYDKYSTGKIRKIVNDGAGTTHSYLAHQLPDLAGSVISPILLLGMIFLFDWRMGVASLVPVLLGFVTMSFMMTAEGQKFQKLYYDSLEEMSAESVEYIRGIPVVKTFGQSLFSFKKFHDSIIRYKEMVLAYTLLWRAPMSFYTAIMQASVFFLVPMAIFLIGRGENTAVVLADFILYLIISPQFALLMMKSMLFRQNSLIAEQAIDRLEALLAYPEMKFIKTDSEIHENSVEFRNVTFSYEGTDRPAVDKVSFTIKEGETVALVGSSGGGKTTLARLAARFWDTDSGEVLIGGVDVKEIPKKLLMDKVSFVFQTTKLRKGSIRENILFGNESASDSDIEKAVELSQSREIIDSLKDGLNTEIGTKGTYLSGGEQQRIALARAMVKNSPIILLDEATAFADPENEHLIRKALASLGRGKTTLMIAHRLTSVSDADKILVVDRGRIAEEGTHDELLNKEGLYRKMWDEYQESAVWKIGEKSVALS